MLLTVENEYFIHLKDDIIILVKNKHVLKCCTLQYIKYVLHFGWCRAPIKVWLGSSKKKKPVKKNTEEK